MNYLQAKDTEHDTAIATNAADIDALEVNNINFLKIFLDLGVRYLIVLFVIDLVRTV